MPFTERHPSMRDGLRVLLGHGVDVATVLDVGVLTGTPPLIQTFREQPHHLFEPVPAHVPNIQKNYANLAFTLHKVAVSDRDGEAYLACTSLHNNGNVTHAQVEDAPVDAADRPGLVSCEPIRRARLDTLLKEHRPEPPYILKVDVDGHELAVLDGAEETLAATSIVVIEAPLTRTALPQFFERAQYLMARGFDLVDIVDVAYYNGVLWQADLIFVPRAIVNAIPALRPFEGPDFQFQASAWYPYTDRTGPEKVDMSLTGRIKRRLRRGL